VSLRPTQAVLAAVLLLALALCAVPLFLPVEPPRGSATGLVIDARGFGVADVPVLLFNQERLERVAETRTDARGNFTFALDVPHPRVLVSPGPERGLLPAWSPAEPETAAPLALVLHPRRELAVRVSDLGGSPIPGAEVRVYDAREEPTVLALATSDAEGTVVVGAPARAHVRVTGPGPARASRWRLDLAVPAEGLELAVRLPPAELATGTVHDPDGLPLEGIVLLAHEDGQEGWTAFTRSDADGRFVLPLGQAPGEILALDPRARFAPGRIACAGAPPAPLEVALAPGVPCAVRVVRGETTIPARLWTWWPAERTWSWGVSTSAGPVSVAVPEPFGIHAAPLDPALVVPDAWDLTLDEPLLTLEARPAR